MPQRGNAYIDTYTPASDQTLEWPETSEDEDDSESEEEYYDRVEDEDWENAERDFTKQYNRLRQHAAVRTGNAQGTSTAIGHASVAPLPAVNIPKTAHISSSTSKASNSKDHTSDQLAALAKYNSRLAKIDTPYVMGVGVNRKVPDKSDRATNEQVLDPRTRLILFKMIGRGLIDEVNGCISTGKEANVYHAIYKTSILVFKDRDKYVTGEFRFRRGYSRNPRKMVRLWAEKEMRNLKRLVAAGIRAPDPLEVRENVLVMTLVAIKMADAALPPSEINALYEELVLVVRRMFHVCKLVHADLSEYNIMYHEGHLWIIDVSQSVEHDHPSAFDFLRNDIKNVEDFFGRLGVECLGLRRCFEFVTKDKLTEEEGVSDADVLKKLLEERLNAQEDEDAGEDSQEGEKFDRPNVESSSQKSKTRDAAHEDSVFMNSFIPRTLNEVYDPERDVEKHLRGDELIYSGTIGLLNASDKKGNRRETEGQTGCIKFQRKDEELASGNESASGKDDEDEAGSGDEKKASWKRSREGIGTKTKSQEGKSSPLILSFERKKAAKAEAQERRKNKMPKSEKKRIIKKTKS
ncbi:RIO1-domain-containing protein [Pholiota molesta]|nr:RIO1-domain-containing protein [Pholiota molesta]